MSKRMARSSDEEEEVTIAEFMGKIRNNKGVKRDRQDDMNQITKDKISDAFGLPANGVEMEALKECNKDNELLKRWNDMFGDRKRKNKAYICRWSEMQQAFETSQASTYQIMERKVWFKGLRDDDIEDDVYVNERESKEYDTEQSLEHEEDWQITNILVELQRTYNEVLKAKNKFQSTVCNALKKFPDCDIVKEFDRKVKSLYKGKVEDEDGIEIDNTSKEHEEDDDEKNVSHSEVEEEIDGEDVKQVQNTNKEGEDDIEVHNTNKEGDNNDKEGEDEREVYSIDKEGEGEDEREVYSIDKEGEGDAIDIHVSDTEVAEEEDGTERAIFSMIKKKSDVLFQSKCRDSICVREDFESLFPKQCLYSTVIDCFARVLNYEEKYKPEGSPKRLFLGCHLLDDSVVKAVMDGNKEEFDSVFNSFNIEVITWMDEEYQSWRIGSFDINEHFYLLIVDMKMNKFLIVDNSSNCISTKDRYSEYPNVMLKLFSKVLYIDNHPNIESIKKLKPVRAKMPCRTKDNKYDCGIYVMRHMEDYVLEPKCSTIMRDMIE
ncbi:hypothetical protein LXL04_028843 [Taraxacum kok-saghyz]